MKSFGRCVQKHTKYQPTKAEFKCPECGAKAGVFTITDSPDWECDLQHPSDMLMCDNCGLRVFGDSFVRGILKQKNLVPCKHCKGKGLVKKT